jgi:hypothetical protein
MYWGFVSAKGALYVVEEGGKKKANPAGVVLYVHGVLLWVGYQLAGDGALELRRRHMAQAGAETERAFAVCWD